VPCIIGANGWEEIVDVHLDDSEKEKFSKSADAVRSMNAALADIS